MGGILIDIAITILVLAIILGASIVIIVLATSFTYDAVTTLIDDINSRKK